MADEQQRAYARGYAAGVRRGRTVAKFARAQAAKAATIPASAVPVLQPAPDFQPKSRARLHIVVPSRVQGIDMLWERELDADDLEMARDQIALVLNRWIAAKRGTSGVPPSGEV